MTPPASPLRLFVRHRVVYFHKRCPQGNRIRPGQLYQVHSFLMLILLSARSFQGVRSPSRDNNSHSRETEKERKRRETRRRIFVGKSESCRTTNHVVVDTSTPRRRSPVLPSAASLHNEAHGARRVILHPFTEHHREERPTEQPTRLASTRLEELHNVLAADGVAETTVAAAVAVRFCAQHSVDGRTWTETDARQSFGFCLVIGKEEEINRNEIISLARNNR